MNEIVNILISGNYRLFQKDFKRNFQLIISKSFVNNL